MKKIMDKDAELKEKTSKLKAKIKALEGGQKDMAKEGADKQRLEELAQECALLKSALEKEKENHKDLKQ